MPVMDSPSSNATTERMRTDDSRDGRGHEEGRPRDMRAARGSSERALCGQAHVDVAVLVDDVAVLIEGVPCGVHRRVLVVGFDGERMLPAQPDPDGPRLQ